MFLCVHLSSHMKFAGKTTFVMINLVTSPGHTTKGYVLSEEIAPKNNHYYYYYRRYMKLYLFQ